MKDKKKDTLTEVWLRRIKNNPVIAGLIIFSIVLAGVASFTESAKKIYQTIIPDKNNKANISDTIPFTVEIMSLPSTVNHGANVRPNDLALELYSDGSIQKLAMINYPVSKQFVWSPKTGDKVVLNISIGEIVLRKEYSGRQGFPKFLSEFHTGNRVFRPKEFDANHAIVLKKYGIEFISVSFGIKGAEPVIKYLSQ